MSATKAKIIGIAPQLVVKDVVKSAEYYRDVFAFKILSFFGAPPVYAMVERDSFEVHFGKSDSNDSHSNASLRKLGTDFVIWVPEIEKFFGELKERGADIVQEIVQRSYGREFLVRDCDGHVILVVD